MDNTSLIIGGVVLGGVVLLVLGMVVFFYGSLWFQAFMSGAHVSLMNLVGMSLRQVKSRVIVQCRIMASQAGLPINGDGITTRRLEAHFLAGGSPPNVIRAIIAAHRANLNLSFDQAAAIDLAGRDVLEAVRTSVNPKVIACPDVRKSGRSTLSAIARNGVELLVRAQVTVRTNLDQLIGGATEDTIIARVGEGIITAIGSSDTHFKVMENPDLISRQVLARGLDSQTAFQIVSIDIADIDVGQNVGARLQADQAEADTRVARARAEERRALALAVEQEMRSKVAENRAKVVLNEAKVPEALATAFRTGGIGRAATATILIAGFVLTYFLTGITSASDYKFPTRAAALGNVVDVMKPSVGEIIRGQEPRPNTFLSPPPPATNNSRGNVSNALADAEMATRPPDPVGAMDAATIPETIKPKPTFIGEHTATEPLAGELESPNAAPNAVANRGGWNTLLLVFALAAGGMAAYTTFAALDYKQRWEQALLDQNERLLGGISLEHGYFS